MLRFLIRRLAGALMVLALVAVMGQGAVPVIIALAISSVPDCARIARGIASGVMKMEFIEAGYFYRRNHSGR